VQVWTTELWHGPLREQAATLQVQSDGKSKNPAEYALQAKEIFEQMQSEGIRTTDRHFHALMSAQACESPTLSVLVTKKFHPVVEFARLHLRRFPS